MSFTDRNINYAKRIVKELGDKIPHLRIDADFTQTSVPSKVKEAELMKIPYIIVVGDKEEKEKNLAVRVKGNGAIKNYKISEFLKLLEEEIEKRT